MTFKNDSSRFQGNQMKIELTVKIFSDSKYAIDGLTKNLPKWQDEGFHTAANGDLFELTVAKLRERKAPTELVWVKGHSGIAGNEGADILAGEGSRKPTEDAINTDAYAALFLPGRATATNMALAKAAAADAKGGFPPARKIWRSTFDKDISRSIRFFLWMLVHDGYKVGKYWDNVPTCQQRGQYGACGIHESMEHILTQCAEPGQKEIWDLASEVCQRMKTGKDLRPTIGQIMAGGATKCGDPGTTRLYKILITESAHLIWRIRNEQVIQQTGSAPLTKIRNRWLKIINNSIDCAMTDKFKYEKKALKMLLVKRTWKKLLRTNVPWPKIGP
ncbi:hypothetical protein B0H13DRAFT_2575073 [Mycena leptocephala]|nr:hypothetical protein B0H13DRAFT_2575073 [Mycena leptocephala]